MRAKNHVFCFQEGDFQVVKCIICYSVINLHLKDPTKSWMGYNIEMLLSHKGWTYCRCATNNGISQNYAKMQVLDHCKHENEIYPTELSG